MFNTKPQPHNGMKCLSGYNLEQCLDTLVSSDDEHHPFFTANTLVTTCTISAPS